MGFDPNAVRSGAVGSTNREYQGAWVVYVDGQEVPAIGWDVDFAVWSVPTFRVHFLPDVLLTRIGAEDRVQVAIFYLDYWWDPARTDFRLLVDGEIVGWSYSNAAGMRSIAYSCAGHLAVFQQLYFNYMTTVDDVIASRSPDIAAQSVASTPGPFYPYGLFHQGLTSTAAQMRAETPGATPDASNAPGSAGEGANAATPIQAPYEFVTNVIRGVISKQVPDTRRAVPAMNFFGRWIRRTNFHNRFVRLPLLEDPARLAARTGVFPIFNAARNAEALTALQRHAVAQVGNAGNIWNLFQQVLGLVNMEIGTIPNACAVLVQLNDTTGGAGSNPVDGRIVGAPNYDTPVEDQRSVERMRASAEDPTANLPFRRPPLSVESQAFYDAPRVGDGVVLPRASTGGTTQGISRFTPVRLAQYFVKPQGFFWQPPSCNVVFPSMIRSWGTSEDYAAQPTRCYVNDGVMTQALRADGNAANREFMLHALTVGYPEEANALLRHHAGNDTSGAVVTESGRNLLVWPEEFYKGPVTARVALPAWFQMLRQFSNARAGAATPAADAAAAAAPSGSTGALTDLRGDAPRGPLASGTPHPDSPVPATARRAQYLLGGPVSSITGGYAFGMRSGRLQSSLRTHVRLHAGTDFPAAIGTPLYAVLDGTVFLAEHDNFAMHGTGPTVMIRHRAAARAEDGRVCDAITVYMHLSRIPDEIRHGRTVTAGTVVGYVGNKNGNPQSRAALIRECNIPLPLAQRAAAVTTPEEAEALLQQYVDRALPPAVAALPEAQRPQYWRKRWQVRARAVAGFMQDSGPHCHFEVIIEDRPGARRPPRADGSEGARSRLDPVLWLRQLGVAIGPNQPNHAPAAERRGGVAVAPPSPPPPPPEHDHDADDLPDSVEGVSTRGSEIEAPSDGPVDDVTRPAVAPSAALPGTGGAGAPAVETHTVASAAARADAPANGSADFAGLFELYAAMEYARQRYAARPASAQLYFDPYLVVGFPGVIFDVMAVQMHTVGYVQRVSHRASISAGGASIESDMQMSFCRNFYEFIADIKADAQRFGVRVTTAPADPVPELREVMQDEANAETFYRALLYGNRAARPVEVGAAQAVAADLAPEYRRRRAAFVWTDALGYAVSGRTAEVTFEGPGMGAAVAQDRTGGATRRVRENLDPARELAPRENSYAEAWISYDVAMQHAARPCCTLDEYVRFWHGGRDVGGLQVPATQGGEAQVGQSRTDYSYVSEIVTDMVKGTYNREGRVELLRGQRVRYPGTFYDHIYRLRPGPGPAPTDAQRGYTVGATIEPVAQTSGLPADYPDTRADWASALRRYREKVRAMLRPST